MFGKKNYNLKYILLIIVFIFNPAVGQELPATLVSDKIIYNKTLNILYATGNVKVKYGNTYLQANEIRYNANLDKLLIIGEFTIKDDKNTISSKNNTIIDAKLKNGIIEGAQVVIDNEIRLSAQNVNKVDENFTVLNSVIASTCKICSQHPTPFWQIRAKKVIHNKEKQKIYFKNARLDLLGLPVLYIPALNIPEPGISRASGLLVPQFSSSNKIGFSAKIPYYVVLGKSKDMTFTPYIMSTNSIILETEYRQYTKNGFFELTNAFPLHDNLNNGKLDGFIESSGSFNLKNDYVTQYKIDLANTINFESSEKPFKNTYNYAKFGDDRLENMFDVTQTKSDSFFRLGTSYTQSFRYKDFNGDGNKEKDPNIPVILPELYFKKNLKSKNFGEKYSYSAQSINLANLSIGQYSRIGGMLEWQRNWKTSYGFNLGAVSQLNTNVYLTQNKLLKNAIPLGMVEVKYPLKRKTKKTVQMFEPISQIILSPNKLIGDLNDNEITSDSTTAEFEETNLFSINRFPGFDEIESGMRANIGFKYIIYEPKGWKFDTTVGRVYRQKDLKQFGRSKSTGLNKLNSDYVGAFSLKFPQNLKISTRFLLNNSLHSSKNETQLNFKTDKFSTNLGYVWLDKQSVLNIDRVQNEVNLNSNYTLNQNWKIGAAWRQNLETFSPISGKFAMLYENDCAKVNFLIKLKYSEKKIVDRTFGIQLFLSGLGSNTNKKKFNNRCGG